MEIFRRDTPVAIPQRGHFDYELRMRDMDGAGIDMAIVSLTCPNVYWGGEAISCEAARDSNDSMAAAAAALARPHPLVRLAALGISGPPRSRNWRAVATPARSA